MKNTPTFGDRKSLEKKRIIPAGLQIPGICEANVGQNYNS